MVDHGLAPRRLLPDSQFNWVYVVDLVVALIVTIFFLFYFNRVFGSVVAYAVRTYTWHKYRIYIDVQALQFSPLAGRLFFKGFRYHGHNETIVINDGYITWRYWLRRVREAECSSSSQDDKGARAGTHATSGWAEGVERKSYNALPCRIKAKARGIEWFIYNRSPAYDSILENISSNQSADTVADKGSVRKRTKLNKAGPTSKEQYDGHNSSPQEKSWASDAKHSSSDISQTNHEIEPTTSTTSSRRSSSIADNKTIDGLPALLRILPIKIECSKGAVVMGNPHTRSVMTAKFDSAVGRVDARKPCSPLDQYKQVIDLDFIHPIIQFRPNRAYRERQSAGSAKGIPAKDTSEDIPSPELQQDTGHQRRSIWSSLREVLPQFGRSDTSLSHKQAKYVRNSVANDGVPGEHRWLGLTRYIDEEDDLVEQERWKAIEYGRFETIVDSPGIAMSIHWDVPGKVPREAATTVEPQHGLDINGNTPPDWSIDLRIRGGEVHYGPWADRQRTELQSAFFPTLYKDAVPATVLAPDKARVSTVFKLLIEVEVATKLVLHTREESKDWRWKGNATGEKGPSMKTESKRHRGKKKGEKANLSPEIRPYGWLDVHVLPDSTVNFTMDLLARPDGYRNRVDLDLRKPEMASSVNHDILWRSKSQIISCDLSNPLEWNSLRQWSINIQSDALEVFLLRDHIFLLTDLINDWSSSPAGDFYTFVPFKYIINLQLTDFRLYVNANDSNIINNPSDVDDNTFIVVWGEHLDTKLIIPLEHYQPSRNAISFEVDARDGGFELRTPQWNTQHSFLKDTAVAALKRLGINGSYDYATSTSPALTDTLILKVHGSTLKVNLHGFLIRYLMKIKDNYFGEDLHFRTLEEYKVQVAANGEHGTDTAGSTQHSKISNDLDVVLNISADSSCAVLPCGLYTAAQGINLDIASVRGDLRFTNYYMDLAVAFSPIMMASSQPSKPEELPADANLPTEIFIDGMNLYGHRLFGLPPVEPTYVCNWDFDVGSVFGECTPKFVHGLMSGIRSFGFSFEDAENALPPLNPPAIHDVTFLRVRVQPILVWLVSESAAFRLSLQSLSFQYNDWAGLQFSEKLNLLIRDLTVAVVDDREAAESQRHRASPKRTQAYLQTNVDVRMLTKKNMYEENRSLQQKHIISQDVRTHRTPWLLHDIDHSTLYASTTHQAKIRPPAMQFPHMPEPINYELDPGTSPSSASSVSTRSETSTKSSSRKSPFLSNRSPRFGNPASIGRPMISEPADGLPERNRDPSTIQHASYNPAARGERGSMVQPSSGSPSPYRAPYFPLRNVIVDLQDVPVLANQAAGSAPERQTWDEAVEAQPPDLNTHKSSVFVSFNPGVRALCTPMALGHIITLLGELEPDTAEELFDALQVDTMNQVRVSTASAHEQPAKITEVSIHMPSLQTRFLSMATRNSPSLSQNTGLSLDIERLKVVARISQKPVNDKGKAPSNLSSTHVSLGKIFFSLFQEHGADHNVQSYIACTISDTIIWAAVGEKASGGLTSKDTDIVATSKSLDRALPSAYQTMNTMYRLAQHKSNRTKRQSIRLRLLVLSAILAGEKVPDPPFLTRASYVLRSANNHLRSNDSWKLMARLRHILASLPAELRAEITEQCINHPKPCPEDAENRVVVSLEHWRGWDVPQVKQSLLMHKVYGSSAEPSKDKHELIVPMKVSIRGGRLRLAIVVGHSQNTMTFERMELAALHNQPAVAKGGFIDPETFSVGDSIVQVHCAKITTSVNWDLTELMDDILKIPFDELPSYPRKEMRASTHIKERKIHIVASSSLSVVDFVSVNLRSTFLCQGMKTSTLMSQDASRRAINFLISADTATSEVQSHSKSLIVSKLRRTSVFCSTDNDTKTNMKHQIWKVAASCNETSFKMLEDPLVMIEVVDLLIRDEVTYALRMAKDVRSRFDRDNPETTPQAEPATNKAHVTICVDSYLLSLMVLPSLSYRISGGVARTTVQHGLRKASETFVDFDVHDHIHSFRTQSKGSNREIAGVQIPPVNGRLSLDLSPRQRSVIFHTMVEKIALDASALHAILATVSQPEIRSLAKSIDRELQLAQNHFQQLVKAVDRKDREANRGNPIFYDAYVIATGLSVHANSPLSSTTAREGQLDFNLGCLHAKATNRDLNIGPALQFPEIDIRLDSIQAALKRVENSKRLASGDIALAAFFRGTSKARESGETIRAFQIRSSKLEMNMYAETAPIIIDIVGHLQDTLRTIDLTAELRTLRSMRRPRVRSEIGTPVPEQNEGAGRNDAASKALFGAMYSLEMTNIRLSWIIESSTPMSPGREAEDLVLSFSKIDLSTRRDNAARLLIENFQLQMVPISKAAMGRSQNSALLPEVVFNVAYLSTGQDRRLAFQAAGKSLDLRLTSQFILPASDLRRSIAFALQEVRKATADCKASTTVKEKQTKQLVGSKKFASILVDADFAGAVVYVEGRNIGDRHITALNVPDGGRMPQHGRYNQFTPDNASSNTTLRSPGLAFKIEYRNGGVDQESLNAEIKVDASSNVLHPTVVPLVMEISSSVKEMVGEAGNPEQSPTPEPLPHKSAEENQLRTTDPSAIFGKTRVNFGLRICEQKFGLSCQPYAKVAATARFEDIYVAINTVKSDDHGQFFTVSAVFTKPQASVQHAYSRDSTGSLTVESVFVSLMSSKHVSAANGLSVILKISPMNVQINARQLQDVLLFRDIWIPQEIRRSRNAPASSPSAEPQAFIVQRYQQVATAGAFPWNATVYITRLDVQLDLGQSLGRSAFNISNFWISSKKTSDWEQNLCLGFDEVGVDATGRMSGLIELQNLRVRTSIQWPMEDAKYQTPLIQASLGIDRLRLKGAFDYQAFVIMNITTFDFMMYNVQDPHQTASDRLVAVLEGDKAQVYCTAISASQGLALYQAIQRLIQEKQAAYETSLKDIERFLRRKSTTNPVVLQVAVKKGPASSREDSIRVPIRLQTNVVVSLGAVNFGVFPSTFFDNQMFKLEAKGASARFSVALQQGKVYSTLRMTLGELRVALSGVARPSTPKKVGDVAIDEVVASATANRGGLILGVPKTLVSMQIWQMPESNHIDYIFRSSFEGNIDVGWNYSRISFIRGMHDSHVRALAQRLGKPLPQLAVQITGGPKHDGADDGEKRTDGEQEKITAVVNVPQSKYDYTALQPALVDTPQLRNLGEATPPLEWIGLHRERLPNLTHQIVMVSLLEVAKEVEDAYTKILGSS